MTDQIEGGLERRVRGSYTTAFRRQAVEECFVKGASVSGVALRHGINANLLFGWRKDPRYNARLTGKPDFLPVALTVTGPAEATPSPAHVSEIAITLRCGAGVILRGAVDEAALTKVLRAIRRSA